MKVFKDALTGLELLRICKTLQSMSSWPLITEKLKACETAIKAGKWSEAVKWVKQVGNGGRTGAAKEVAKVRLLAKGLAERIKNFAKNAPKKPSELLEFPKRTNSPLAYMGEIISTLPAREPEEVFTYVMSNYADYPEFIDYVDDAMAKWLPRFQAAYKKDWKNLTDREGLVIDLQESTVVKKIEDFFKKWHLSGFYKIIPAQTTADDDIVMYKPTRHYVDFTSTLWLFNQFLKDSPKAQKMLEKAKEYGSKGAPYEAVFTGIDALNPTRPKVKKRKVLYAKTPKEMEAQVKEWREELNKRYAGELVVNKIDEIGISNQSGLFLLWGVVVGPRIPNAPAANEDLENRYIVEYRREVKGSRGTRMEPGWLHSSSPLLTPEQAEKKAKDLFDAKGWSGEFTIYGGQKGNKPLKTVQYTSKKTSGQLRAERMAAKREEALAKRTKDFVPFEVGKSYVASTYLNVPSFPVLKLLKRTDKTGQFEISEHGKKKIKNIAFKLRPDCEVVSYKSFYTASSKDVYNGNNNINKSYDPWD